MSEYTLTHGSHATRDEGMCLMEAVAYLAGEPHTDAPACACPVLTTYAIAINDAMGKGSYGDALRARYLHDLAPMLVGSKSTPEVKRARAYVLTDHAVRVFAPLALDSAGLGDKAEELRSLGAVVDQASASTAQDSTRSAYWVAREADAKAAKAAVWDAADAADWAALAGNVTWDVAEYAARAAHATKYSARAAAAATALASPRSR